MRAVPLESIATITAGQSPPGNSYNELGRGLPFFQGKADFGDISPITRKWCTAPKKVAEAGDILISVRAPVGPTNIASERCCIGRGLAAIRPVEETAMRDFVHWAIRFREPELVAKSQGSTFAAIGQRELRSLEIPVPPLDEQRRIVRTLNEADRLRRLRATADARTDRILRALFLRMFGDPETNPMDWPKRRFDQVCESRLGKMLDAKQQTGANRRPYLRNANVLWDRLNLDDLLEMDFDQAARAEFRLRDGDILICEGGEVGRAAIWNGELSECYFQKALHRARPLPDVAVSEFVVYLFWELTRRGALQATTSSMTFSHLTGVKLKALRVPVPPISLQRLFAARVRLFKRVLVASRRQAGLCLDSLFRRLLHDAFSAPLPKDPPTC